MTGTTGWWAAAMVGQALAAGAGLVILLVRVYPAVPRGPAAATAVVLDVWAPVAVVLPLLFLASRVADTVQGAGWATVGAPSCVGVVALGVAMWRLGPNPGRLETKATLAAATVGAGVLLLLLSGADDLTIWTGQSAFAMGALLLWINTPTPGQSPIPVAPAAGTWLALAVVLSAGQGALAVVAGARWPAPSTSIAVGYSIAAAAGAVAAGPTGGLRVGGWAAALGTLFGIGTISVIHIAPMSFGLATGSGGAGVGLHVARGFGYYATEAVLLIMLPAAAALVPRAGRAATRLAALVAVLAGGALASWRLLAI